jgi:hypothetical protein
VSQHVRNLVNARVIGKTRAEGGQVCSAAARKGVLLQYADRANDDGSDIFVSKERIAAELEVHRSTVITATQALLDDGLLVLDRTRYPDGRRPGRNGFTYHYRLNIAAVMALPEAWPAKCRNSDTLDDALVEGDEPLGRALRPVDKPVRKSGSKRRYSDTKASELPRQSVGHSDMNSPSRTYTRRAYDSAHRRADPDYARDQADTPPPANDDKAVGLEMRLRTLRRHLATAGRGEEIATGDYAGMLPSIARDRIAEEIAHLEREQMRRGAA